MEKERPRDPASGSSPLRGSARRGWRIWLGILSLAVGFALVSLASGNYLAIGNFLVRGNAPRSGSAAKGAVRSVVRSSADVTEGSSSADLMAGSCTELSSIELSFSPTPIAEGNVIWFHSAMRVDGLGPDPATIFLSNSTISFAANGTNYRLPVADAAITFDPGVTAATTSFDAASNRWITVVPSSLSGRAFVSGLAFPVPAGGLPEDVGAVTWSSEFSTDTPGVSAQWQWAAAVYTTFSADYNGLGVKPVDGGPASQGANLRVKQDNGGVAGASQDFDSVGKPMNLEFFVTAGARGEGGSDFTGSFGAAARVMPCARMAPDASGSRSKAQPRTNTVLSDRSSLRTSGVLTTTGFAITKTCPTFASPGSGFTCTFTVKNLNPANNVINVAVTNQVPFPGC